MPASTGFLEPDLCMKIKPLVATVIIVLTLLASAQAQKIGKESIRFEDKNRTFYLFVPETSEPSSRMPVIVLLGAMGFRWLRDGGIWQSEKALCSPGRTR